MSGAVGVEKALQYQHGGDLIHDLAMSGASKAGGVEVAMSLSGAKPLIPKVNRQGECFTKRLRKVVSSLRLRADVAGGIERIAEHDGGTVEFAQKAAEGFEILAKVSADEGKDRLGGESQLVGDSNADAAGAEVEAQKARRHILCYREAPGKAASYNELRD